MTRQPGEPEGTAAVRRKYAEVAGRYDRCEALPDRLLLARLRSELVARASGWTLEVSIGTGRNLPHYAPGTRVTGVDLSLEMLQRARERAAQRAAGLLAMDAQALAFRDAVFDTVLASLSLCTIPDPLLAVREMVRVCRPEGRLLFLEHVRSDNRVVAWAQDRLAGWQLRAMCCRLNQDTEQVLRDAGLEPRLLHQRLWGVFRLWEAPAPRPSS